MKNLIVIFGGKTVEHDISILTGLHAAKHAVICRVYLVYLDRENRMFTGTALKSVDYYISKTNKADACFFMDGALYKKGFFTKKICDVDCVLNCCHGGIGENGELAAFFHVIGIPITSCGYVSAANMQSKTRTKEVLTEAGFLQTKYVTIKKMEDVSTVFSTIHEQLGEKVIVKPDNLGSSIGIALAKSDDELTSALELAFSMDSSVIVEEYLENVQEINCSAFMYGDEIRISECEIIKNKKQVFDFETKYLDSGSGFIKKSKVETADNSKRNIEEQGVIGEIQKLTRQAYEIFGARGVVRADFMVVEDKVYLNEINTIPGFLAYHLWAKSGVPYGVMIDMIAKQAMVESKSPLETVFKSDILLRNRSLTE